MSEQLTAVVAALRASIQKSEAEKAQVDEAIAGFQSKVTELEVLVEELQNSTPPEVDLSPVQALIAELNLGIEGIYVPPAQEEPEVVESEVVELTPAPEAELETELETVEDEVTE